MSKGLQTLRRSAAIAACVGSLSLAGAEAQQPGQAQQPRQSMAGLAIYSTDGMKLGEVIGVKRRPDGNVELIEADLGSPLGLGTKGVLISPDDLRWKGDHIELQMGAEHVRSILQGQKR